MRTTLTIDDNVIYALKKVAQETGKSYKDVVNETLRAGLTARKLLPESKTYRLKPASLGEVSREYNLDKALQLADHLEDEEIARKLELRK